MSDLSITKRGVVTITSADVGISKDIPLPAPVKPGSSFLAVAVKDRRRNALRQRVAIAITDADVSGTKDSAALGTAVDTAAAEIITQIREKRTDAHRGATVDFLSATVLRATFNPPAAGDTINLDVQVLEHKPRRGVILRLLNATTLRAEWDLQLAADESIAISWDLVDLDEIGDMLLETQFRLQRVLGELGANSIQDLMKRDPQRRLIGYRHRTFLTKTQLLAATRDIPDGEDLEDGEISRRTVIISIDSAINDRKGLVSLQGDGDVLQTPGLTETEE